MDGDDLLDDDGNLFNVVLAKSVANGLEFEVKWELWVPYNFIESTDVPQ